jgi:hypothetical protein
LEDGIAKRPDEIVPFQILPSVVESVKQVIGSRLKLFNGRGMSVTELGAERSPLSCEERFVIPQSRRDSLARTGRRPRDNPL